MCNVDGGETHPPRLEKNLSPEGRNCVKCGAPAVLIIRIHDPFCKACFQVYVVHRFRAAIGKSKLIRDGDRVLVAFSGGANSAALLHLIQDGLSERAHKRLRFTPTLLHVDECGMLCDDKDERRGKRKKLIHLMRKSTFPSYLTDLEQCLYLHNVETASNVQANDIYNGTPVLSVQRVDDPMDDDISDTLPLPGDTGRLKKLLASLASLSSQEDVVRTLRTQTIVTAARHLGFSKVLTADCSTRLSIRILTDVSQGRGSQVSLNTNFSDERNCGVMFVRPVRDLNSKELTMYNNLFGVESVFIPCLSTKKESGASIERLTQQFVTGLQADFPSTVSNIVRTSEKLGLPDVKKSIKCCFCQSPLDTIVEEASALRAVQYSQKMSRQARTNSSGAKCEGDKGGSGDLVKSLEESNERWCYGCRLSLHNVNAEVDSLPDIMTGQRLNRKQQKEQIKDFLLDECEDEGAEACVSDEKKKEEER